MSPQRPALCGAAPASVGSNGAHSEDARRALSRERVHSLEASNEALPCPKSKPGLAAFGGGSLLVMELKAGDGPSAIGPRRRAPARLSLRYLSSYEGMGRAHVRCVRGCECQSSVIDAHRRPGARDGTQDSGSWRVSVWNVWRASGTLLLDQAGEGRCWLEVLLLNETSSGRRKFKLGGVTMEWGRRQC